MDTYERIGYAILALIAVVWLGFVVAGSLAAFPYGIPGLLLLLAIGVLFVKVLKERIGNTEDDYYSRHVDK